jgi:Flp pilus assembly protein TadG
MRRLSGDRGAVAVLMALLIIPLLACTALVVDFGSAEVLKGRLQNAADAGALAIAQQCAAASAGCNTVTTTMTATAVDLAKRNAGPSTSDVQIPAVNKVLVTATATVNYLFAPAIGVQSNSLSATSSASWGLPVAGTTVLPITFSWCAFKAQTGGGVPTPTTTSLRFSKTDGTTGCTGPSGNAVPGGFGWLKPAAGTNCVVTSSISGILLTDPGSSSPCSSSFFTAQVGQTVLLPIFDKYGGTGSGAWYQVYGYAAFRLTKFNFQGNNNWVEGYFLVFLAPSAAFTYGVGTVDLGARLVKLTA